MNLTQEIMYEVRFGPVFSLPKRVQDIIAKLRITPVEYNKPIKPRNISKPNQTWKKNFKRDDDNWRINVLREAVSGINLKIQENYNETYVDIVSLLNKAVMTNVDDFAKEISSKLEHEDETIRLRVSTFIFNKAITENTFANLMAQCVVKITEKIPEVHEDILFQISMFPVIYNTSESLVYPLKDEADFPEKVFAYFKQKEKKRGYAKFMTELLIRKLIHPFPMKHLLI